MRQRSLLLATLQSLPIAIAFGMAMSCALGMSGSAFGEDETAQRKTDGGETKSHFFRSFLGAKPPELSGLAAHWVNQPEPVTLQKLHGQVVWLEFNF
jgi:hypothetical protein